MVNPGPVKTKYIWWRNVINLTRYVDPSTAQELSTVSNADQQDFVRAVDSAEIAQKDFYESTTGAQRGKLLHAWYSAIEANVEDCKPNSLP